MGTSLTTPYYKFYVYSEIEVTPDIPNQTEFGTDIDIAGDDGGITPDTQNAAHSSLAVDGNNFYLVFKSGTTGGDAAIYFIKSSNGGTSWSTAVPITSTSNGVEEKWGLS